MAEAHNHCQLFAFRLLGNQALRSCHVMLHGLEAEDLASVVRKFADDWQLDLAKLLCLRSDQKRSSTRLAGWVLGHVLENAGYDLLKLLQVLVGPGVTCNQLQLVA